MFLTYLIWGSCRMLTLKEWRLCDLWTLRFPLLFSLRSPGLQWESVKERSLYRWKDCPGPQHPGSEGKVNQLPLITPLLLLPIQQKHMIVTWSCSIPKQKIWPLIAVLCNHYWFGYTIKKKKRSFIFQTNCFKCWLNYWLNVEKVDFA